MGGCTPSLLFCLRQPSPGVYKLYGKVNGNLQEDLCQGAPSRTAVSRAPSPRQATADPHLSRRLSSNSRSGSFPYGVTALFPWILVHTRFCLCPPRMESLVPSVLWKSCNQILLTFKGRFPRGSQSLCQISSLGSLT